MYVENYAMYEYALRARCAARLTTRSLEGRSSHSAPPSDLWQTTIISGFKQARGWNKWNMICEEFAESDSRVIRMIMGTCSFRGARGRVPSCLGVRALMESMCVRSCQRSKTRMDTP